ncbi:MAG: glycoside hydrolase family 32 protein [Planctomycetota bacterium]
MNKRLLLSCVLFASFCLSAVAEEAPPADEWATFPTYERVGYDQPLRPQFHFTSRVGWINDPNGMVFYDGEWHMCFQHFAKGNASGPKSWGHAVSTDLVHWTQLPHAINPYPNVKWPQGGIHAIWSGSAVVDELNALGKEHDGIKTLFAIYTATHAGEDKKAAFFQAGAYSTDKGRTWTKINDGKPIIDHMDGFDPGQRDPCVFYHPETKSYVLIMEIGGKDAAVRLWRSTDLMHWDVLQDIPKKSAECIGMFTAAVDGDVKNMKWVITNAGTGYEVGDFDGKKWTGLGDKDNAGPPLKFEFGDSYYAAQAFNQAPDHRVVHVGWLRTGSLFVDAGMPFTQQLSVPAEITLRTTPEGIRMFRNPVKELAALYEKTSTFENVTVEAANTKLATLSPELIDMTVTFVPGGDMTLNVRGLAIQYDAAKKEIAFTNSARVDSEKAANEKLPADKRKTIRDSGRRVIAAPEVNGKVKLRVLVDRTSLELFVNDGQSAASFVVIPDTKNRAISISGGMAMFSSIVVNELKSSWPVTASTGKPKAVDDAKKEKAPEGLEFHHGSWKYADGAMLGEQVPTEKHMATIKGLTPFNRMKLEWKMKFIEPKQNFLFVTWPADSNAHAMDFNYSPDTGAFNIVRPKTKDVAAAVLVRGQVKKTDVEWHTIVCVHDGPSFTVTIDDTSLTASDEVFSRPMGPFYLNGGGFNGAKFLVKDIKVTPLK